MICFPADFQSGLVQSFLVMSLIIHLWIIKTMEIFEAAMNASFMKDS